MLVCDHCRRTLRGKNHFLVSITENRVHDENIFPRAAGSLDICAECIKALYSWADYGEKIDELEEKEAKKKEGDSVKKTKIAPAQNGETVQKKIDSVMEKYEKIAELYKSDFEIKEIMTEIGCGRQTVYNALDALGIERKIPGRGKKNNETPIEKNPLDKGKIIALHNAKWSNEKIAKEVCADVEDIRAVIDEHIMERLTNEEGK